MVGERVGRASARERSHPIGSATHIDGRMGFHDPTRGGSDTLSFLKSQKPTPFEEFSE
jgi:hypothetical protein